MPQKKLTVEDKLVKYKISASRYEQETVGLLNAGFTKEQADKIILRKSSQNTINYLLNHHLTLREKPFEFSHDQMTKVASNNGGSQALKTVCKSYQALINLGFTKKDIVAMTSNDGGSQALQSVLEHTVDLLSHGYTLENIVALAAHIGGSRNVRSEETLMSVCAVLLEENENTQYIDKNRSLEPLPTSTPSHEHVSSPQDVNNIRKEYDELFECLDADVEPETGSNPHAFFQYRPKRPHHLITADYETTPSPNASMGA